MRFLAFIAALVVFIIVAVLALLTDSTTIRDLIGWTAIGLACLTVAFVPAPPRNLG